MDLTDTKNIRVVVRVRPRNRRERELNQRTIIRVEDKQTLTFDPDEDEDEFFFQGVKQFHRDITRKVNKKLQMNFDHVFDDAAANVDIFEACMKPLVSSIMDGFNCSTFVYGATGAGKTHTMLGNEEQPGITFLTIGHLFSEIKRYSDERKFDIGVSYLEVYNEQVMNLLTKTGPLKLREDASGVVVGGLVLKPIYNAEELLELLAVGNRNRTQHPTDANAESSRSHAIFQVHLRMINKKSGHKNTVKLSMIDLAGSERAASTKGMGGMRFTEGANINKSLLALGNCINKLAEGLKHIPYRDSNLTRIIKDSLGGNCRTVMIANVSPSSLTYEDTYNTLKYASRAKKIRINAKLNVCKNNMPREILVKQVTDQHSEIINLKEHVQRLESQLTAEKTKQNQRMLRNSLPAQQNTATTDDDHDGAGVAEQNIISNLMDWYKQIDEKYAPLINATEHYYTMASKENVLELRAKVKRLIEECMSNLVLDGFNLPAAQNVRIEASVSRMEKQIECYRQDLERWRQRRMDSQKAVTSLIKTIEDNYFSDLLMAYVRGKEFQLESTKINVKSLHVMKINSIYHAELQHLMKIVKLSNSISQENYYLLRANNLLTYNLQESYEQLKRMKSAKRDVKFVMDDIKYNVQNILNTPNKLMIQQQKIGGGNGVVGNVNFTAINEPVIHNNQMNGMKNTDGGGGEMNSTFAAFNFSFDENDQQLLSVGKQKSSSKFPSIKSSMAAPKRTHKNPTVVNKKLFISDQLKPTTTTTKKPIEFVMPQVPIIKITPAKNRSNPTTACSTSVSSMPPVNKINETVVLQGSHSDFMDIEEVDEEYDEDEDEYITETYSDQHNLTHTVTTTNNSADVNVDTKQQQQQSAQQILMEKQNQIRSKTNSLKKILSDTNGANPLYKKINKITNRGPQQTLKSGKVKSMSSASAINLLKSSTSKENKRFSPKLRRSPRSNIASQARARPAESADNNLRPKFKF